MNDFEPPPSPSAAEFRTPGAMAADVTSRLIDAVAEVESDIATAQAKRAKLIDELRRWSIVTAASTVAEGCTDAKRSELARRSLTAELACALRVPEVTANRLLDESETLVNDLPATLTALTTGLISYRHAQVVVDHATSLPLEVRAEFESTVLPVALTSTAAQFDRKARHERERTHPESIVERTKHAVEKRHVAFEADRDGMAWLHHHLPAVEAIRIDDVVEQLARGLRADDDPRTVAQLRSDVLTDLLLRDPATGEPRPLLPTVIVTVPVLTLLGCSDTPASLDGYGPIDPETARRLSAHAPSFMRLLTHPETGATLSVGREHYTPPADLRAALRIVDETCRFPGCNRRARRCELDHTEDWADGGRTEALNLAHLCAKHHHLKHETEWSTTIDRDRTLRWRSPAGRIYSTFPASPLGASLPTSASTQNPTPRTFSPARPSHAMQPSHAMPPIRPMQAFHPEQVKPPHVEDAARIRQSLQHGSRASVRFALRGCQRKVVVDTEPPF